MQLTSGQLTSCQAVERMFVIRHDERLVLLSHVLHRWKIQGHESFRLSGSLLTFTCDIFTGDYD